MSHSTLRIALLLTPLVFCFYVAAQVVARDRLAGKWTIHVSAGSPKARLQLTQTGHDGGSFDIPLQQFQGLPAGAIHDGAARVEFQLVRDAGAFTFTGSLGNGSGSGEWIFKGNSAFTAELHPYGYAQLTEEQLYQLALNSIDSLYIRELARAGYRALPVNELIALYSNNVRAEYITGLAAAGYSKLSPGELIALKSNGVDETYIRSLQSRGYTNLSVHRILSIRTNPGNQQ